ncbi:hypothetical protein HELRODRAFT_191373 [Helobdella robusta]|uniref:Uncharacterized protein n=1 Tax=Helobdella robusta TaxID=6412 RepID=T1FSX6_HELRO|nr:hypothetical protein HELRODRAFT_191373 [Helobdella robusta]ESO05747.1 hypothetical protein HELRODRAFT_191373 [Helobdella robusta]
MTEEGVDVGDPHHHHHYQHQSAVKHEQGLPTQILAAPTLATATTSLPTASSYRCFSSTSNKTAFNALPIATNLFVTLPLGLSKSHFIFTKPLLPLPDQLTSTFAQNPATNGCMPTQDGLLFSGNRLKNAATNNNNITISTTSPATVDSGIVSNNSTLKSKPLLQPYLISSQPKTIILRSNPSSQSVLPCQQSLNLASGNQFIKLSYTPSSNLTMRPMQLLNGDVNEERKVKSSLEVEQQHLQQQQQLLLHHQQQQLQLQQMHVVNRNNNVKINLSATESKVFIHCNMEFDEGVSHMYHTKSATNHATHTFHVIGVNLFIFDPSNCSDRTRRFEPLSHHIKVLYLFIYTTQKYWDSLVGRAER